MNTFRQLAIEILKKAGTPLHYTEITWLALESGILETEGAMLEASINAQITVDIKNKTVGSDFIKTALGAFVLNSNKKLIEIMERKIEKVVAEI